MAEDLVEKRTAAEFLVTVLAILIGLVVGKYVSKALAGTGIPIASGDPIPLTLPGQALVPWRR